LDLGARGSVRDRRGHEIAELRKTGLGLAWQHRVVGSPYADHAPTSHTASDRTADRRADPVVMSALGHGSGGGGVVLGPPRLARAEHGGGNAGPGERPPPAPP